MRILILATTCALLAGAAGAGPIERACLSSDRNGANRSTCGCIQQVANRWLSRSDQRLAAKFFADPHRAQEVRQSDNPRHEEFWQRYRSFGSSARAACS
jgi:hypothetical protein